MLSLFAEGFLIGLLVCMPMGAIGMLCLRYILVQGKASGLAAGFGIAVADAFAAFIAALGLTAIIVFIKSNEIWIHTLGSFILIGFGVYLLLSKKLNVNKHTERGLSHIFAIMFIITITNPLTVLSFTGIFVAISLDSLEGHILEVLALSTGVFFGSLAWWIFLILCTMLFKINEATVRIINELAGSILMLMGIFSLYFTWIA